MDDESAPQVCYCDEPRDFPAESHYHYHGTFTVTEADLRDDTGTLELPEIPAPTRPPQQESDG